MDEKYTESARCADLVATHRWRFASTMRWAPHWYSMRHGWTDDADFVWLVEYIRRVGTAASYGKRTFIYYEHDGWSYWTMGSPIERTTLINRKKIPT